MRGCENLVGWGRRRVNKALEAQSYANVQKPWNHYSILRAQINACNLRFAKIEDKKVLLLYGVICHLLTLWPRSDKK